MFLDLSRTVLCTVPNSESPNFGGFPVENPTNKANRPQSSSKGNFFVRVRFGGVLSTLKRLSEYGSVACLVERPTWETRAEQYSDTVLETAVLCEQGQNRSVPFLSETLQTRYTPVERDRKLPTCP